MKDDNNSVRISKSQLDFFKKDSDRFRWLIAGGGYLQSPQIFICQYQGSFIRLTEDVAIQKIDEAMDKS